MVSAVILAGGKSRRMGRDKTELPFRGQTLLEGAVARFSAVFPRVAVSVARADACPGIAAEHIVDRYVGCGPMAGLHAALTALGGDVFLTAADMPLSDPALALRLIERCGQAEVCLLEDADGRPEPLFALYRQSVLPIAEQLLEKGEYAMHALLARVRLCALRPEQLGLDPEPLSLRNVNRPEEYARLLSEFGQTP